jgi:polyribonucleotide nucleotidyltransferase
VQVIATILSVDQVNPPDMLALNGASVALLTGSIPFNGPIAALRVGRIDNNFVLNPTFQDLEKSDLDLVVAGNRNAILMVEAGANEVSEEDILQALSFAHKAIVKLVDFQERFVQKYFQVFPERGRTREVSVGLSYEEIEAKIREFATGKLREAIRNPDKLARERAEEAVEDETIEELATLVEGKEQYVSKVLAKIKKEEVRRMIIEEGIRADGRRPDEIRPINCAVGVLPRPHGSGLFTRGQTQVLSVLTLGTVREEQMIDGLGVEESKRFMHHYNFPPFSTGDIAFLRAPRRREIGHGALVERALLPVIPKEEDFPYTIRIVSEVLESNGSTSMASVCGSTLALMDAGVQIKAPVAGIAMGLVKEGEKVAILTDILGMEDALGDMDFKVAGTSRGITALQMDMKIEGVNFEILSKALEQARQARLFILDKMLEAIPAPREELSPYAPRIMTLKIPVEKIGDLIGPGGRTIRSLLDEVGPDLVTIDIEEDGTVFIASKDQASAEKARMLVEQVIKEVKKGERFIGTVTRTTSFGAFVEIIPGVEGLVHISKLTRRRIPSVESVVKPGDRIMVEVIEIDRQGRLKLAAIGLDGRRVAQGRR